MMPHQLSVVVQRGADHAGLAAGELRHGVEQMREAASVRGAARRAISSYVAFVWPAETTTPALHELADDLRRRSSPARA